MVAEFADSYHETDQTLYRGLKSPVVCIMDEEKNHFKSGNLSTSCMSGLTLDDSWISVDQRVEQPSSSISTTVLCDRGPCMPLRGRRSLVLPTRMEEEQDDFSDNRFAAGLQQPQRNHQRNLCTPPTRRPSSDCSVLTSDSSTAMLSLDLTSAYKSFTDSSVISVETEILEQDENPSPNLNQNQGCLPLRTHSRGTNKNVATKTTRRLTPTLEVPEEQDQSNWGENTLDERRIPSDQEVPVDRTTTMVRDNDGTTRKPARQKRESITLDAEVIKAKMGNHHWGVKSSLTMDSMLFDDSAVGFVEEPEDDHPSKRTSWAVGSSLTFSTFEDSLSALKQSGGHDQYLSQEHDQQHLLNECANLVSKTDFLCQEMNRLRFSSHSDSMQNTGSGHRTLPSTFSCITPCSKPIRTQSTNTNDSKADSS